MTSEGFAPSFRSFNLLIQGLFVAELLDYVEFVLREMIRRHGFVPRMGTWRRLRMLPRTGDIYIYIHNDVIDEKNRTCTVG